MDAANELRRAGFVVSNEAEALSKELTHQLQDLIGLHEALLTDHMLCLL